jgi:hypothetical protein
VKRVPVKEPPPATWLSELVEDLGRMRMASKERALAKGEVFGKAKVRAFDVCEGYYRIEWESQYANGTVTVPLHH